MTSRRTGDVPRDRLRELLDAVLDEDRTDLGRMAAGAFSSPFHFTRQLSRATGESPVAMRRRVELERAAWRLGRGATVTEAALGAGFDSVDGFSRAYSRHFGHLPSAPAPGGSRVSATDHWLPAPNGIHFHPPTSLWLEAHSGGERAGPDATIWLMLHHDLEDTALLLEAAADVSEDRYRAARLPGLRVVLHGEPEPSLAALLAGLVTAREVWVAALVGAEPPVGAADDPTSLAARHDASAEAWVSLLRELDRRDAWDDRFVDALCVPPESFTPAGVVAHVLTFAAVRRGLARQLLREDGQWPSEGLESAAASGDPISWMRNRRG
ncbi:helix-turn-helix transcriptional regulator [Nocardioides flavescens]|uniref:Helix-turn-helix domain-containing protein n=1 Tax=Nocardioides flavescens TaxID=2691959 RepID=A0A6L7F3R5_9ACTN|nr:helix-turn-helix transcriptional regulator [Nocardioides flavescens]MXG91889.1 helix-turn-helix domain-containing protein [Nocardioides flavescens]